MYETGQALIWIAVAALYFTLTAILKRRIYVSALPGAAAALLLALLGAQMAYQCAAFVIFSAVDALIYEIT